VRLSSLFLVLSLSLSLCLSLHSPLVGDVGVSSALDLRDPRDKRRKR
jgi:hypothetical protein